MISLLVLLAVLETAQIALTSLLFIRLVAKTAEQKNEEAVERAMDEEKGRRDTMAEGFENIMSYSVNGKTGFEAPDPFGAE